MHIGEIKAMARQAHDDAAARESLFEALQDYDRDESVHAAWALTHLPKEDNIHIAAHREELVMLATTTPDTSLRRITLSLLERLEWDVEEVRTDLLDFCLEHLLLPDEPYGVRALCIKLAYKQCRHYPELCGELKQCLLLMEPTDLGAGVKHTRNKILKNL